MSAAASATVNGVPLRDEWRNIASVDLEDWYQGIEQPLTAWSTFAPRIERSTATVLEVLGAHGVRATFFALGHLAEAHRGVVRDIAAAGHELATHGFSHDKIYDMSPEHFRDELRRSIRTLEDASGQRVRGHRAAYFSITERSRWALDILVEEGIEYDASIFPGSNYRYGIPGSPPNIHRLDSGLIECPVSTFKLFGRRVGVGGAYLRILPARLTARGIRQINAGGQPAILYLHPWELDPDHPRVKFRRRAMLTHYHNLRSTRPKLDRLLSEFAFGAFDDALHLAADPVDVQGR